MSDTVNQNRITAHGDTKKRDKKSGKARRVKVIEPGFRLNNDPIDFVFLIIVVVLLIFGLAMVFSASYMEGMLNYNDPFKYIKTQGLAAVIGIIAMYIVSSIDYHIFYNTKIVTLGFFAVLGLLTYTTIFGNENAGARRWIEILGQSFQTSEAMKPVLVIFLAFMVVKNQNRLGKFFKGGLPLILVIAPVCINMVFQRHISGLLIMLALTACVIVLSGMPWKNILIIGGVLLVGAGGAIVAYSLLKGGGLGYILTRFESMGTVDSGSIGDENWQLAQSLIAIGSGGWFGLGFGESRQKYLWLPESQNDFIISIIVEELGYIGGLVVIILFTLFVIRGFSIARRAPDKFGMLVAAGLTFQIGLQAILNIGVACDAFPNTGVALPFFSSGGTALVIQLVEMGVILSISRHANPEASELQDKNPEKGEDDV